MLVLYGGKANEFDKSGNFVGKGKRRLERLKRNETNKQTKRTTIAKT